MGNTEIHDLPLSVEQRGAMASRIARAVLNFQDQLLEADADTGSLCQVWLPEISEEGDLVLRTKGLPFCVAGVGDLLALFRCISCRYCFGTDASKPDMLGAPGRVFTTQEPEMSRNVQKYSKEVYLRASEAQQCRVHSTVVLPLFTTAKRTASLGVVEVVQTRQDMSFAEIVGTLARSLEDCNLYTCEGLCGKEMAQSSDQLRRMLKDGRVPSNSQRSNSSGTEKAAAAEMDPDNEGNSAVTVTGRTSDAPSTPGGTTAEPSGSAAAAADEADKKKRLCARTRNASLAADLREALRQQSLTAKEPQGAAAAASGGGGGDQGISSGRRGSLSEEEVDMYEDDDLEDETEEERARRKGKGVGNPGKPGKRLRLEDLQSQFGVGLKEAANRLGICPTTLKRACRRHGIQRWPRRQLLKLSRAIDQINATGSVKNADGTPANGGLQPVPGPDTRWTALAQLIPGIAVQPDNRQKSLPSTPLTLTNCPPDQRMLQRVDSVASVDPYSAQHMAAAAAAAAADSQQRYQSSPTGNVGNAYGLPGSSHPSAQHMHSLESGADGDGSVHGRESAFQYMQVANAGGGDMHMHHAYGGNSMPLPIPVGSSLHGSHSYPGAITLGVQQAAMPQVFDGTQHVSAPLSLPSLSMGPIHSPSTPHQSLPVVQGMQGSFSGQTMLSYAEQRHMLDSKMQEHSQAAWMQHTGNGAQHQMDLFPSVDDLDDDVGLVDAEVLEMLLSR